MRARSVAALAVFALAAPAVADEVDPGIAPQALAVMQGSIGELLTAQLASVTRAYAQVEAKLARQRILHTLVGGDLAAGEFPQPALVQVIVAASDQHFAGRVGDHTDGHAQHGAAPAGVRRNFAAVAQVRYSALMRT